MASQTNPIAAFTYTGNFNFNASQNTIANFFSSGGGTVGGFTIGSETVPRTPT